MRVRFGNIIYESEQITYPGGRGNELYVTYPKGIYQIICSSENVALDLFTQAFERGYVNFNRDDIDYNNSWDKRKF